MPKSLLNLIVLTAWLALPLAVKATEITYQGQLRQAGEPFTGTANLQFQLLAALVDGSGRSLEVWVNGAPLNPRQNITATPFALLAIPVISGWRHR